MKIIAFYLPQFHEIPENNRWWGQGFTEWTNVKMAKPLFTGHDQPRVPLNSSYYNLLDVDAIKAQYSMAKEHGLHGFCFYHYWFNGKKLLEKPVEIMNNSSELNMPFCLSWANESWTNAWKADEKTKILVEQKYGNKKDWEKHFQYLLTFFNNKNYIVNDNKPLFVIYRPELIGCLNDMLDYWEKLAMNEGFAGIDFAYQHADFDNMTNKDDSRFAYNIEYQPTYAIQDSRKSEHGRLNRIKQKLKICLVSIQQKTNIDLVYIFDNMRPKNEFKRYNYDDIWQKILARKQGAGITVIPGAFVDWDNTPRKAYKGFVIEGATPEKFGRYLEKQIKNVKENYRTDMLFMFAWNEWAEGGYLEPDETNQYGYLEAIKGVLDKVE
jgi:hypothetical protein